MHASAGLPAAAPVTDTLCTEPADPNTIAACETGSSGPRQLLASGRTAPIAPVTAPCDGFCGTLPVGRFDPAAGIASFGLSCGPTALAIALLRSPAGPVGAAARSFCDTFASGFGASGCGAAAADRAPDLPRAPLAASATLPFESG